MLVEYYVLNVVLWGLYLRYMLFIKKDIREELQKNWELSDSQVDRYLFNYWLAFTVFWPVTLVLIVIQTIYFIINSRRK
tara:strand:+ start:5381 stop:5617 length:237 start_codon:yes stop_codon:yes gene_type:complete